MCKYTDDIHDKNKYISEHNHTLFSRRCTNTHRFGYCRYGYKCTFYHEDTDEHREQIEYHYAKIRAENEARYLRKDIRHDYYDQVIRDEKDELHEKDQKEEKEDSTGTEIPLLDLFDNDGCESKFFEKCKSEDGSKSDVDDHQDQHTSDVYVYKEDDFIDINSSSFFINIPFIDDHPLMSFEEDQEAIKQFKIFLSKEEEDEIKEFYLENKMICEYFDFREELLRKISSIKDEFFTSTPIMINIDFIIYNI